MTYEYQAGKDRPFTFHVGRMCGGGYGFLFRWFGRSDVERWRIGWSS